MTKQNNSLNLLVEKDEIFNIYEILIDFSMKLILVQILILFCGICDVYPFMSVRRVTKLVETAAATIKSVKSIEYALNSINLR